MKKVTFLKIKLQSADDVETILNRWNTEMNNAKELPELPSVQPAPVRERSGGEPSTPNG